MRALGSQKDHDGERGKEGRKRKSRSSRVSEPGARGQKLLTLRTDPTDQEQPKLTCASIYGVSGWEIDKIA